MTGPRQPRVLLTRLSLRTSARGNEYLSGHLGASRLVGFLGEDDAYGNPCWEVYVVPREERQDAPRQAALPHAPARAPRRSWRPWSPLRARPRRRPPRGSSMTASPYPLNPPRRAPMRQVSKLTEVRGEDGGTTAWRGYLPTGGTVLAVPGPPDEAGRATLRLLVGEPASPSIYSAMTKTMAKTRSVR